MGFSPESYTVMTMGRLTTIKTREAKASKTDYNNYLYLLNLSIFLSPTGQTQTFSFIDEALQQFIFIIL